MIIKKSPVNIEIRDYARKGRGVCSNERIEEGMIIESLPVLVLEPQIYLEVKKLPFFNHTFVWDQSGMGESGAIGFGFASLCNHSAMPNAVIRRNYTSSSIDLIALRKIRQNEEVTIKYKNTPFQIT